MVRKAASRCCRTQWAAELLGAARLLCGPCRAACSWHFASYRYSLLLFVVNKTWVHVLQGQIYNSFCHCALSQLNVAKFGYLQIFYIKKASHTRCFWNSWAKQRVFIFGLKTTPNVAQLSNQQKWQPDPRLSWPSGDWSRTQCHCTSWQTIFKYSLNHSVYFVLVKTEQTTSNEMSGWWRNGSPKRLLPLAQRKSVTVPEHWTLCNLKTLHCAVRHYWRVMTQHSVGYCSRAFMYHAVHQFNL